MKATGTGTGYQRAVLGMAAVVLIALIAYAGYWHVMAGRIRDALVPWAEARQAEGYLLRWDDAQVAGFPTAFRISFTTATVGAQRPVPTILTAPLLVAWAAPWNLQRWEFSTPDGARVGDAVGAAGFDIGHLDGAIDIGDDAAFDATALDLAGRGLAQGTAVSDAEFHLDVPAHPPASHLDPAFDITLQLANLKLPVSVAGFGDTLTGLSFAAQIKGALPLGPLPAALGAWRDGGGTVELQYFRLRWGALLLDASGTMALDERLQPEGAMSAVITGQDAAVDVAVMTGALKPDAAGLAKAALGFLAKPTADGGSGITLPLTVQQSNVFLGPAKIAAVPLINWN
jgi:hypothetical protein